MGQRGLSEFSAADEDGNRPDDEAVAVAGRDDGAVATVVEPDAARYPESRGSVELSVTQVDYTLVGSDRDERPIVHVFGRTADNTLEHVRVHGFRPYFYAPIETVDEEDLTDIDGITGWDETDDDGEPFRSIRGDRLVKIYGRTPRDVGEVRERFTHYEADILFPNRFLIDKDITQGVRVPDRRAADDGIDVPHEEVEPASVAADLRVNTFDIEVDDRRGFPEDGEEPIVCISSHDSYRDEYIGWLFNAPDGDVPPPDAVADHELIDDDATVEVRAFEAEEAMLEAFLEYIEETDPDLTTGWNFTDFDMPYLIDRLQRLEPTTDRDLDYNRLSRVQEVWESDWQGPNVKGRVVFDLLYGYQRTQFSELDSYRLDAVAEAELGMGKERYPGDIGDLWEEDPERLLEYNLRDVELCVEIDRKQEVIPFWEEVASFVGCKLEDATTPGDAVDMYVLHNAHGKFALPSKGQQEAEEFEGGAVFDPIVGVREMVAVLDLASLYPMAMTTMNASPETKVDPEDYDGETYVAPNGQHYRKDPDGIMREMIDELLSEREERKARRDGHEPGSEAYKRYDRQQQAVKVIMNSLYGVSGWDRFRLYDKENAAAITSTGREVIKFTEKAANELDKKVVYGDTDSVMLELDEVFDRDDISEEIPADVRGAHPEFGDRELSALLAAIDASFEIEEYINDRYDDFARESLNAEEHRFEIEFEKLYRRFFQAGKKKRYAGHLVWKEGNHVDDIDITGFEYKRSDIAPITKEVQERVIEMIVRGEDLDRVKAYVRDVIEEFRAGEIGLEEIAIPGGIGKRLDNYDTDTAHVRGAKYANLLLGTNFNRGSKPKRLYLERVDPSFFDRFEAEHPELFPNGSAMDGGGQLDAEARWEKSLYNEFRTKQDVICFEYADQIPDAFTVDYDKMLEKTLKGPIARVLEALDVSWEEVKTGQEQTGLGNYM